MRPQAMSEIVAPLQEAGLVSGAPDPNDRRQTLISLTPKCLRWIKEGKTASHDWLTNAISQKLSVREQRALRDAPGMLRRLVDLHHELALDRLLPLCRSVHRERDSSRRLRCHRPRLPKSFCQASGQGTFLLDGQVVWGFANMVVAYLLLAQVGSFDWRTTPHVVAFGLGFLLKSLGSARQFGKFHGGNTPTT